jgi:triosephosphate isomerase
MARPKLIVGNWKMYTTRDSSVALAQAVAAGLPTTAGVLVGVAVPAVWLSAVAQAVRGTALEVGGQNCHFEKEGAFTGEVSADMLKEAGATFVLIGHSERRHGFGETDDLLNKKLHAAVTAMIPVIFCVGETLAEREADQTEAVLERQLTKGFAGLSAGQVATVTVAYEPVWAIGTGKVATTEQAQTAHKFIRDKFAGLFGDDAAAKLVIQYGGSVKPDNADALLHQPDIDGALVGGASLKADTFLAIVNAAGK